MRTNNAIKYIINYVYIYDILYNARGSYGISHKFCAGWVSEGPYNRKYIG